MRASEARSPPVSGGYREPRGGAASCTITAVLTGNVDRSGMARRELWPRARAAACLLTIVLASLLPVRAKDAAAESPKGVRIVGTAVLANGKSASGAVVNAIHLASGNVFHSDTTSSGHFTIRGCPYGYYLFAVEEKGVLRAAVRPFDVPPGRSQEVILILHDPASSEPITVPGLNREATAIADVDEPRKPFFKRSAGVATIVGGSLLALLLLH